VFGIWLLVKLHISCRNNNFIRGKFEVTITDGHIELKSKKPEWDFSIPALALFVQVCSGNNNRLINPYFQTSEIVIPL